MNNPDNPFPVRKPLRHATPRLSLGMSPAYFITICAEDRTCAPFLAVADAVLSSARFYHEKGRWFLHLLVVMPDHLHLILQVPPSTDLARTGGNWKRYLVRTHGLRLQTNFFDTRLRDEAHFTEKWNYMVSNPVSRKLVSEPGQWPYVLKAPDMSR